MPRSLPLTRASTARPESRTSPLPFAALALLSLAACGGSAPDESIESASALSAARYLDAIEYLGAHNDAGLEAWLTLTQALRRDFDGVCGDTFCEGDYSDLQPLSLRCSVAVKTGALHACTWSFAGSLGQVTASTGTLKVNSRTYACPLPVTGTLEALLQALNAPGDLPALRRPLPGSPGSIYDALGDCHLGH